MNSILDAYVTGGMLTVILYTLIYTYHHKLGILPEDINNTGLAGQIVMVLLLALLWPAFVFIMICGGKR